MKSTNILLLIALCLLLVCFSYQVWEAFQTAGETSRLANAAITQEEKRIEELLGERP